MAERFWVRGASRRGIARYAPTGCTTEDLLNGMNGIMAAIQQWNDTHDDDFNPDNIYFIPANEPNNEWYIAWRNIDEADPLSDIAFAQAWQTMDGYFATLYQLSGKRPNVRILTPPMSQWNWAERFNSVCERHTIDGQLGGYSYMLQTFGTGELDFGRNDGYSWNSYWRIENAAATPVIPWGDGNPCPQLEPPLSADSHHIFQFFPEDMQTRIRNAARTTGRHSFITEADVFSNPDTFKDADPNIAAHLSSFLVQELQPEPPEAIRDNRGAQHAALWLLTQDLLGGNPQPTATHCEDLRFTPTHTVPEETQWHMAYLTNGTPCRWFTDLWHRP